MEFLQPLIDDPQLRPWLPLAAFALVAAVFALLGWLIIRFGRRRAVEGLHRRALVFGPLTEPLANLVPVLERTWEKVQREVRQAGYYHYKAAHEFLALRNAISLAVVVLTLLMLIVTFDPVDDNPWPVLIPGMVALIFAYGTPRLVLQSLASARVRRIQTQLPDGLDMITMCMSGGLSLQHAMDRVSQELEASHEDLSAELNLIRRQADAHSLEHSLEQFAKRIDVPEVQTLAALVSQTEQLGANVGVALREFADGIRRSFRQRAEERGNRTSVQMMLPVALCLAPPVYILLLAPAVLELRRFIIEENDEGGVLTRPNVSELTDGAGS